MKKNVLMGAMVASMMMVGCGSDNDEAPVTTEPRFSTKIVMGDTMELDSATNLAWIGSVGTAGGNACIPNPAPTDMMTEVATAKDHCTALVFAGHGDWRMPTASENTKFITDMMSDGKIPFYANPSCPRIIGIDGEIAVTVNTHNTQIVGDTTPWPTLLEMQGGKNFGVKCVREN